MADETSNRSPIFFPAKGWKLPCRLGIEAAFGIPRPPSTETPVRFWALLRGALPIWEIGVTVRGAQQAKGIPGRADVDGLVDEMRHDREYISWTHAWYKSRMSL